MTRMASAPHLYPGIYIRPICIPRHRIIENIPEVMNVASRFIKESPRKATEITASINDTLKLKGSKIVITRIEYLHMITRFRKCGKDYVNKCIDRATILSEMSV